MDGDTKSDGAHLEDDPEISFVTFNVDVSQLISTLQAPDGSDTPVFERTSIAILVQRSKELQGRVSEYNQKRQQAGNSSNKLIFKGTGVYVVFRDPKNPEYGLTGILTCNHVRRKLQGANPVFISQDFSREIELQYAECIFERENSTYPVRLDDVIKDPCLDYAFFPCDLPDHKFLEVCRDAKTGDEIGIKVLLKEEECELSGSEDSPAKITKMSRSALEQKMLHDIETIVGLSGSPIVTHTFGKGKNRLSPELIAIHSGGFGSDHNSYFGYGTMAEAIQKDIFKKVKNGEFKGNYKFSNLKRSEFGVASLVLVCVGSDVFERINSIEQKMENNQAELTRIIDKKFEEMMSRLSQVLNPPRNQMNIPALSALAVKNEHSNQLNKTAPSTESAEHEGFRFDSGTRLPGSCLVKASQNAFRSNSTTLPESPLKVSHINVFRSKSTRTVTGSCNRPRPLSTDSCNAGTRTGNQTTLSNSTSGNTIENLGSSEVASSSVAVDDPSNSATVLGDGDAVPLEETRNDVSLDEWRRLSNLPQDLADRLYCFLPPAERVRYLEDERSRNH